MTFFPVDDRFHSHPKAAAVSLAAIGLWTLAGSWAKGQPSDGDVPQHMITSLSRGATELADELVTAGLWRRTKAGYRFHQWSERNPTRSEAIAAIQKKSLGGRLGNHRRWHTGPDGKPDDSCEFCPVRARNPASDYRSDTDRTTDGVSDRYPNPPIQSNKELKPSPPDGGAEDGFDAFWAAYPPRKNNSKHKARLAYQAALKLGVPAETILLAAKAYAEDRRGENQQYTKHAVTWLHARPWEDDPPEPTTAPTLWPWER